MDRKSPREGAADRLVPLGVLGAFLFSLVGGVVYYVLWSLGIIAAISGVICVICAMKGYEFFARRSSRAGIAAAVVVAALVMILSWYFCFCSGLQGFYQTLYDAGEIEYVPSLAACLQYGFLDIPANPRHVVDPLLSLAMGGVGCWGYVTYALRRQEAAEARQAQQNRTMELARLQAQQADKARQTAEAEEHE